MCEYISVSFSGKVSLDEINGAAREWNLRFEPWDGERPAGPASDTDSFLRKWTRSCDCGTRIGSLRCERSPDHEETVLSKLAGQLRKKRWSAQKIERWLAAKRKDLEKDARARAIALADESVEIDSWLAFINRLFETTKADSFGVMRHWDDRRIRIEQTLDVRMAEVTGETLMRLPKDCLLRVSRG